MQRDKTDTLIHSTDCPAVPFTPHERKVYVKAVPSSSSLRYVFNIVMTGLRGAIGWDLAGECLILYLQIEKADHINFPDLEEGAEVWACFRVRNGE